MMRFRYSSLMGAAALLVIMAVPSFSQDPEKKDPLGDQSEKEPIGYVNDEAEDCDRGVAEGCFTLGLMHEGGLLEGASREAAESLYMRACGLNLPKACLALGAFAEDQGAYQLARGSYGKACRRGVALACSKLASLHEMGKGALADLAAAEALFDKACKAGEELGCVGLTYLEADR